MANAEPLRRELDVEPDQVPRVEPFVASAPRTVAEAR
jgi:hypothetical protein